MLLLVTKCYDHLICYNAIINPLCVVITVAM